MPIDLHSIFAVNAQSSEQLAQWLYYRDSLTDKLLKIKGEVDLELISQEWVNADWWDKNLLKIQDELVFQREIIMKSQGISYWYARSIIPTQCYNLDPIFFDRLKNESIKNLIFNNGSVQRIHSITYPVDQQCVEFYWVKKYVDSVESILWVRLAEFSFQQSESFYLAEIMLPELESIL
ncbi:MAG: chorismate lyase [Legionella longbeachae]|nr:chorismate lyase [Legionella longbeachae]